MRRWPPLALACALVLHGPAAAAPYTLNDALALEQLGPVRLAGDGRWAIIQTYGPWETAARYDLDWWATYGLGRLTRVDLRTGAAGPLLVHDPGAGYVAGPVSPSGTQIAVCRLTGHDWELGVVDLASGQARWLGVSPELALSGRSIAWRGEDELVVIAQPDAPVGHRLGYGWQAQARLTAAWADAAAGRAAVNVLGSGRYRDLRAHGPAKSLMAIGLSTGVARRLASAEFTDLEIAPGGHMLAAVANAEDVQDIDAKPTSGVSMRRRRLFLADLDTGAVSQPCPRCDVMARLLSWSPSGARLLIYARGDGGWNEGGFKIVDAATGRLTAAPADGLAPTLTRAMEGGQQANGAWMGETPVIYGHRAAAPDRADWYGLELRGPRALTTRLGAPAARLSAIDASGMTLADGDRLWRIDPRGLARSLPLRASQLVRADASADSERLLLAPPGGTLAFGLLASGAVRLTVGLKTGLGVAARPGRLRLPLAADETALAVTRDAGQALIARRDDHGVERVVLRSPGRPDRPLLALNARLAAITPARIVPVRHPGPDGQALTSWLYLPAAPSPGRKPALIVIPYPGDVHASAPAEHDPGALRLYNNVQVLVGQGYAVLVPSLPYAAGREPLQGLADQVLTAVDAAAAQAPVDVTRLAVWGHSYGGYAALALAAQSQRFKAVIASAAPVDLTSFYGRMAPYAYATPEGGVAAMSSAGWSETGQGRMNGPPWSDPDRYRRNSPITYVDRIQAPVMLITGDLDKDPSQAEAMFTSLYRQNKDAVLLIYRGESHVVLGPGNVRDEYARVFAFLADQLDPGSRAGPEGVATRDAGPP